MATKTRSDWMTNRDVKRSPKRYQGWCGCDRAIVAPHQKCTSCGNRERDRRNRHGSG